MALRILILSRTPVARRMSSPGIRYLNLAHVLRAALPEADVVLASPPVERNDRLQDEPITYYTPRSALTLARRFDVVIAMSFPLSIALAAPFLRRTRLVLDFFSQFYIEWMEEGRDAYSGRHREAWTRAGRLYANLQLLLADHVLCASERQRDSYLGSLGALGRLTPAVYDADPSLRALIDVAPHGVRPESPPPPRSPAGLRPWLREGDRLLLWLGGILYWYDPATLLQAMARIRETHPEAKLLFLGGAYPGGSGLGRGLRYEEAVATARELGLLTETVFFEEGWLPHEAVVDYLAAATAGVATYFTNAETRFAYRTRFMDYIWARLPIVCTEGDILAEAVTARSWGAAVPERDVDALTGALARLLEDDAFAARCRDELGTAAASMSWEMAFAPMVRYLEAGASTVEGRRSRRGAILKAAFDYGVARLRERVSRRGRR